MEDRKIIHSKMLNNIDDKWDKGEGSFFYDATKPVAIELERFYRELAVVNDNTSIDTATKDKLTELCYQNGTFRKSATKAIRKGIFNIDIPINARFGADDTTYIVLEKITDYEYKLECEQLGKVGNFYQGKIIPLEHIEGLETSELTDLIVAGVEEETDEQLRERHRGKILEGEQDGNIAQYKKWADEYDGIGISKIFPLWNGGNTVKIAITDRLFQVASPTLVDAFQEHLDPGSEGLGNGIAPVGAKVTVTGGIEKEIKIAGNIILAEGYTEPEGVAEAVSKYLASVTYNKNSVSYMRTAVAILDTSSIVDLNNFTINGGMDDIPLVGEEIPTLNSINLTVVSP